MAAVIDTGMATVKVCVLVLGEDKHSTGESASDVLLVDGGVGVEGGGHGGKGAYWIPCMESGDRSNLFRHLCLCPHMTMVWGLGIYTLTIISGCLVPI